MSENKWKTDKRGAEDGIFLYVGNRWLTPPNDPRLSEAMFKESSPIAGVRK